MSTAELLKFRCTGCGNCCKDPLLPLTDEDLARLVSHTGSDPMALVKFITRDEIDMDHEPEGFALLRQGRRVMVLRHMRGRCIYLGSDDRCSVYEERPLGCRVFPLDPTFSRAGKLVRLELIQATECPYELDGHNSIRTLANLNQRYDAAMLRYRAKIADWNRLQRRRKRQGQLAQTARDFLAFLGVVAPRKPAQAGRARNEPSFVPRATAPSSRRSRPAAARPTTPPARTDNFGTPKLHRHDRRWPRSQGPRQ